MRRSTPNATPTPIPALAPADNPLRCESDDCVEDEEDDDAEADEVPVLLAVDELDDEVAFEDAADQVTALFDALLKYCQVTVFPMTEGLK